MNLAGIFVEPVHYELCEPLHTATGEVASRRGFQVRLRDAGGAEGWGEALPLPSAGTEELDETGQAIADVATLCNNQTYGLSGLLDLLDETLPHAPAARCAFDVAAHALEARLRGVTLCSLLGAEARSGVRVEARVDGDSPEKRAERARAAVQRGHRTLTLAMGRKSPAEDTASVAAVRDAIGPGVRLRLDPRGTWSCDRGLDLLQQLSPFDIELVEQPVAANELRALSEMHAQSPIPIAVDSSLATPAGRQAFLSGEIASVAIVEPMLLGGLRPALRIARRAAGLELRSYVATSFEGPIGTRAALQLAAALPDTDLDHRLPGAAAVLDPEPGWPAPEHGQLRLEPSD